MAEHQFRFVDNVATADIAFEARGENLNQLFESAALALFTTILDLESVNRQVSRQVSLNSDNEESLLYDWLSELVYLKDVHRELYSEFKVQIEEGDTYSLNATAYGEEIDTAKHQTKTDVKAVTYHKLKIERVNNLLKAFVVLDL